MQSPGTIKRHAELMDRMGMARGLDMEEQVLRGRVSSAELADAVLSCTGCSCPGACGDWLDRQEGPVGSSPAYCRNGALFDALARG